MMSSFYRWRRLNSFYLPVFDHHSCLNKRWGWKWYLTSSFMPPKWFVQSESWWWLQLFLVIFISFLASKLSADSFGYEKLVPLIILLLHLLVSIHFWGFPLYCCCWVFVLFCFWLACFLFFLSLFFFSLFFSFFFFFFFFLLLFFWALWIESWVNCWILACSD